LRAGAPKKRKKSAISEIGKRKSPKSFLNLFPQNENYGFGNQKLNYFLGVLKKNNGFSGVTLISVFFDFSLFLCRD